MTHLRHSDPSASGTPKAVIFDLWGTLIPFPAAKATELVARMAAALAAPADAFARAWAGDFDRRTTGALEASLRRVCLALQLDAPSERLAAALEERVAFHRACFEPRPDALKTLERLRYRGLKLALITDCSSEVPMLWRETPLAPLFDASVFSCAEGVKKPDQRIYQIACTRLGVEPTHCLYVGDGASDELRGATAVGMRAVQLQPGDTHAPQWSGETVPALSEVPRLLAAP